MKRMIAICLAWSTIAWGLAQAVPARPLYMPEIPPKVEPPKAVALAGTAWLGKYGVANRTYIFDPDGTVSYSATTKTVFKQRGQWRFDGVTLFFDHHIGANKMLEFRGVVKDENTIVGEQTMLKTGMKSTVTMQKTARPGK